MNAAQFGLALCRFVFDTSALLFWGATVFLATLVPPNLRSPIRARLSGPARWLALAIFIASIASLPLNGALIADGWAEGLKLSVLADVANDTSIGWAWWNQIAGSILLLALTWRTQAVGLVASAAVSGWLLASLVLTGHAAMDDGLRGVLHRLADLVHVLAAGAWMGALPVVLHLLPRAGNDDMAREARIALRRFSTAGHVIVVLVILSGVANMLLAIGGLPLDWNFMYQRLASLKIAVVIGMILLAVINRYVLVPAMRSAPAATRHFYRLTVAEVVLSILAVLLVAWFGMLEPN